MTRIGCLTLLALGGLAPRASAQAAVQGIRDLDFGTVIPGVQSTVAPTDPIRSGHIYFSTPAVGTRVHIRFTLPNRLTSGGGASMPISFRNGDAMVQGTTPGSLQVFFNPNANRNYRLTTSTDANVWLGGTVAPAAGQAVGTYTAPVVLTITIY